MEPVLNNAAKATAPQILSCSVTGSFNPSHGVGVEGRATSPGGCRQELVEERTGWNREKPCPST